MRIRSALAALGSAVALSLACGQGELTRYEDTPDSNLTDSPAPSQGGTEALQPEQPGSLAPPALSPEPSEPLAQPGAPSESAPPAPEAAVPPLAGMSPSPVTQAALPAPAYSRILWVAPGGSDTADGSQARPFRTVAKALSLVKPGEAVYLTTGTYRERLRLEERGGTSARPLTLRAAPNATPILRGGTGSSTSMIDVRGAYWRVEGLTVDVAGDRAFAALWRGSGARQGVLRRNKLKNGTSGAGVNVAEYASDVLIEGNEIHNFQKAGGGDSHGIILQTTARNVVARGNNIHHNSGDGVQCIGPEAGATISGTPFDNLLLEDNELHENRENGVDIKTCSRVVLRRNHVWGHRRSSTSGGEGVVVHMSARDVTLEDNVLRGNGRAVNVGGVRMGAPPTRIVLRRNLVLDGYSADGNDGVGIRVDTTVDVKVQHNTFWNMPGACLYFGYGGSGSTQGLDARNNIMANCGLALRGRGSAVVNNNLYFREGGAARFRLDGVDMGFAQWRSRTGMDGRSVERAPGFTNANTEDFTPVPGSAARDTGVALGLPFCGTAPDLGAREAGCP